MLIFAGGGGASTGLEMGLNRPVYVAVNHNPKAVAMHEVNHPHTIHYVQDVLQLTPLRFVTVIKLVGFTRARIVPTIHKQLVVNRGKRN